MAKSMLSKLAEKKGFVENIRELSGLFAKADRSALRAALKAGDMRAVCAALNVTEQRLAGLLSRGALEAAKVAKDHPDLAAEALKQHAENGSRP